METNKWQSILFKYNQTGNYKLKLSACWRKCYQIFHLIYKQKGNWKYVFGILGSLQNMTIISAWRKTNKVSPNTTSRVFANRLSEYGVKVGDLKNSQCGELKNKSPFMAAEAAVACRGKNDKSGDILRNIYRYIHAILFRLILDTNIHMKTQRIDK